MAFPTIPTTAGGRILANFQANTVAARTFPSLTGLTKSAGDLLIAICVVYQSGVTNTAFSSWGAGFTEFGDFATSATVGIGCAYKWSTGSETGTFTVTQASVTGHAGMFLLSIAGAHATSPPEAGGYATVTGGDASPTSFSPSWGAEDTLWVPVGGLGETGTGGSWTGIAATADPPSYTDLVLTGPSADVVGAIDAGVAFRQLNAASEDAGSFNCDTSNTRAGAIMIAVRPAALTATDADAGEATGTGAGFDVTADILWPVPQLLMAPMVAP